MANHRQIIRCVVLSDAGMVFVKRDVQTIMEAILDTPVLSPGMSKLLYIFQRSNGIAYLRGFSFTYYNMGTKALSQILCKHTSSAK